MHINLIISTYDRLDSLKMTFDSIFKSSYRDISIHLMIDGNPEIFRPLKQFCNSKNYSINFYMNEKRMDVVYSYNKILEQISDEAVLFASDDIVFFPDCISEAIESLEENFKDGDGLIALKQIQKKSGTAFTLIGKKFTRRFPKNKIYCPDYVHYGGDTELGRYSISIGRCHHCAKAVVNHLRPQDKTSNIAIQAKMRDKNMWRQRRMAGFLWGKDFNLIGN